MICAGFGGRSRCWRCVVSSLLFRSDTVRCLLLIVRGWDGNHLFVCFIVTQLVQLLIFWPSAIQNKTCEQRREKMNEIPDEKVRNSHEMNFLKHSPVSDWMNFSQIKKVAEFLISALIAFTLKRFVSRFHLLIIQRGMTFGAMNRKLSVASANVVNFSWWFIDFLFVWKLCTKFGVACQSRGFWLKPLIFLAQLDASLSDCSIKRPKWTLSL